MKVSPVSFQSVMHICNSSWGIIFFLSSGCMKTFCAPIIMEARLEIYNVVLLADNELQWRP